jgi:hypothetical protein
MGLCRGRPEWPAVRHHWDDSREDQLPDHSRWRDGIPDELSDLDSGEVNCRYDAVTLEMPGELRSEDNAKETIRFYEFEGSGIQAHRKRSNLSMNP